MNIEQNKLVGRMRKLWRSYRPRECFHPEKSACAGPIIGAHSVQKNRYLREISEGGYVTMLEHEMIAPPRFARKGLNVATVFSGFCKHHDNTVFAPIENDWVEAADDRDSFLLAYRAFSKEASAKIAQLAIQREFLGMEHRLQQQGGRDHALFKRKFDDAITSGNFQGLRYYHRALTLGPPLAASTCFCWDRSLAGELIYDTTTMREPVPPLILTLLPRGATLSVHVAHFADHDRQYRSALQHVFDMPDESFVAVISYWLVDYCENWAVRPSYVQGWTAAKRERIEARFYRSLMLPEDYLSFVKEIGVL